MKAGLRRICVQAERMEKNADLGEIGFFELAAMGGAKFVRFYKISVI